MIIRRYAVDCALCGTVTDIYVDGDRVTVKTTAPDGTSTLLEAKKLGLVFTSAQDNDQKSL